MRLIHPCDGFVFDTHTDVQNEFINRIHCDGIDSALDWLLPVKDGKEISYPRSLLFSWDGEGDTFTLEISLDREFTSPFRITLRDKSYAIENLYIGTTYYWRVNDSEIRTFSTLGNSPRFIKIDGVPNVRDIGGGRIKQGLLYRGGELERCYEITEQGKDTFVNKLRIKTELDLRLDRVGMLFECPAGETVDLVQLPYRPYDEIFEATHRAGIVRIMNFLADESHYPVFFHCLGGADRTGMIAMFLRAIAGESEEEIHTDYELTSLSAYAMGIAEGVRAQGFRKRTANYYSEMIDKLREYAPGEDFSQQVLCFLFDCGVTPATIDKIRDIIMEG